MAIVQKLAPPWGHMFNIGLYMEHLKQSSLKPQNLEYIFGMYDYLVDLQSLMKIMALWPKMRLPRGSMFCI